MVEFAADFESASLMPSRPVSGTERIDVCRRLLFDTTRAQQTAEENFRYQHREAAVTRALHRDGHAPPGEQFYGYYVRDRDMAMNAWYAARCPTASNLSNQIVEKFAGARVIFKEAILPHDAESMIFDGCRRRCVPVLSPTTRTSRDGDDVLQISHGNTLLSLGHRFGGPDLDLNERPANGSVTVIDFDTDKPFGEAVTIVSYGK